MTFFFFTTNYLFCYFFCFYYIKMELSLHSEGLWPLVSASPAPPAFTLTSLLLLKGRTKISFSSSVDSDFNHQTTDKNGKHVSQRLEGSGPPTSSNAAPAAAGSASPSPGARLGSSEAAPRREWTRLDSWTRRGRLEVRYCRSFFSFGG